MTSVEGGFPGQELNYIPHREEFEGEDVGSTQVFSAGAIERERKVMAGSILSRCFYTHRMENTLRDLVMRQSQGKELSAEDLEYLKLAQEVGARYWAEYRSERQGKKPTGYYDRMGAIERARDENERIYLAYLESQRKSQKGHDRGVQAR